jgi:ABC-type amino acid transport system permease subunit
MHIFLTSALVGGLVMSEKYLALMLSLSYYSGIFSEDVRKGTKHFGIVGAPDTYTW